MFRLVAAAMFWCLCLAVVVAAIAAADIFAAFATYFTAAVRALCSASPTFADVSA